MTHGSTDSASDRSPTDVGSRQRSSRRLVRPSYPAVFQPAIRGLSRSLGASFVRDLRKAYRQGVQRVCGPTMIAGLKDAIERRAGASISDKDLAKLLVLDPSSISRWQDGGSTSLAAVLTALTEVDGQWSAFGRLVTWPDRSIAALTEAVGFSRHRLQRHRKEETISRNSRDYELPTRSEFEGLLWLFLNPEWFDPESTIECRDQLALAISKSAAKRIRSDSGGAEDQGLRAELDRCERFANVSDLQRLQARWGEAWMIAIEKRGYNWRV